MKVRFLQRVFLVYIDCCLVHLTKLLTSVCSHGVCATHISKAYTSQEC